MNMESSGENRYRMLVLDLDGTVLNDKKRIPEQNKMAIRDVIRKGIKVVVCSGRIFKGARLYAGELEVNAPVIACNGAVIKTMPDNRLIYFDPLQGQACKDVIDICRGSGVYIHAYAGEVLVTEQLKYSSLIYSERNQELAEEDRIDIKVVEDLGRYIELSREPVSKLVIIAEHSSLLKDVRDKVSALKTIEISSSSFDNIEVTNKGVSKGKALEFLCGYLGISPSQTVAIGDNENDIGLLRKAGLGIAMGNAIPELKRIANSITDSNQDNGVAKAVQMLFS